MESTKPLATIGYQNDTLAGVIDRLVGLLG